MRTCPCKDCEKREVGCHGYCELYKEWSMENEIERNMIYNKKSIEQIGRHKWRKKR